MMSSKRIASLAFVEIAPKREYRGDDLPPHLSLFPVVAHDVRDTPKIKTVLEHCAAELGAFAIEGVSRATLGKNNDYPATLVRRSPELSYLHEQVGSVMTSLNASVVTLPYVGIDYNPHVSDYPHAQEFEDGVVIRPGEVYQVRRLCLGQKEVSEKWIRHVIQSCELN